MTEPGILYYARGGRGLYVQRHSGVPGRPDRIRQPGLHAPRGHIGIPDAHALTIAVSIPVAVAVAFSLADSQALANPVPNPDSRWQ
jgi:hypothetical protein